ncbi:MAG: trypsin-like peptidase domain-containing protein, partial [Chloroflexi bacterium]|nr:trypsin-like peptidase domain-containing protein [Chloroflexota bacterium]
MSEPLKKSIVRFVRGPANFPVGAGVLVGPRHVITCAHVVNDALGRHADAQERPDAAAQVAFDFPLAAPGTTLRGRVIHWLPRRSNGGDDIAVVELQTAPPAGAAPAHFVSPAEDVWGHEFRAFGFPQGHPEGR